MFEIICFEDECQNIHRILLFFSIKAWNIAKSNFNIAIELVYIFQSKKFPSIFYFQLLNIYLLYRYHKNPSTAIKNNLNNRYPGVYTKEIMFLNVY